VSGDLPGGRNVKVADVRREAEQLEQRSMQDALGVLTLGQSEKFEKMMGKKTELTPPLPQHGDSTKSGIEPPAKDEGIQPSF
jgi:hypothetical protein